MQMRSYVKGMQITGTSLNGIELLLELMNEVDYRCILHFVVYITSTNWVS